MDLSIAESMSFSNKLTLKDRNYRTLIMDMNLEENKIVTKSQCKNKEKIMRQSKHSLHNCSLCKNKLIL